MFSSLKSSGTLLGTLPLNSSKSSTSLSSLPFSSILREAHLLITGLGNTHKS